MTIRYSIPLLLCVALLAVFAFGLHTDAQTSSTPLTGYAWSDNIGWVDLNCANGGTCGASDFGFSVASDGTVSGYAWSDNIGWISAQPSDVSGCPSAPCTPKIAAGHFQGWIKALAAQDGWDGWISLSGTGYGPMLSSGVFSGYAWGSDVVGWVDFSLARTAYTPCTAQYYCVDKQQRHVDQNCTDVAVTTCSYACSAGACITPPPPSFVPADGLSGHLQVSPVILPIGLRTTVYWNVADVTDCSVTGSNGDSWTGASGEHQSAPILSQTIYSMHCTALPTASPSTIDETATVNIVPIFQEL